MSTTRHGPRVHLQGQQNAPPAHEEYSVPGPRSRAENAMRSIKTPCFLHRRQPLPMPTNGRWTSASKNFMLHFLSHFASPFTQMVPPLASTNFAGFFDLVIATACLPKMPRALDRSGINYYLQNLSHQVHGVCFSLFPKCCDIVDSQRLESTASSSLARCRCCCHSNFAWSFLLTLNGCRRFILRQYH